MKREIKFRVKKVHEDKWSYYSLGDLVSYGEREGEEYQSETWCQFTGLKDKNGKEIWEGDILKETHPFNCNFEAEISVDFFHTIAEFDMKDSLEVIGDTYQNPELIKKI